MTDERFDASGTRQARATPVPLTTAPGRTFIDAPPPRSSRVRHPGATTTAGPVHGTGADVGVPTSPRVLRAAPPGRSRRPRCPPAVWQHGRNAHGREGHALMQ